MNRVFDILFWGTAGLLILVFIILLAETIAELGQERILTSPDFGTVCFAIKLSLFTATIASVFALVISIPVAYLFSRHDFWGKHFFDTLLDLPIVLSPIAVGAMLLIFFNTPFGRQFDRYFGPFVFEVKGIILAQFFVVVGLSLRLLRATFEGIDEEYETLARVLGCSKVGSFCRVVLPLAGRGIVSSFLLVWGRAIGEFGATVTLAGAMTMKTETVPVAIYLSFESANIASALIYIIILVIISMSILFFVRNLNVGRA